MMRIDAHQHFWQLAGRADPWPTPDMRALYRDRLPEDLAPLLARHRIDATVLVQSSAAAADTSFMLALAERHRFVAAVVGWTALEAADAPACIARLAGHPALRGLRPMLQALGDDWIDGPALAPAIGAMLRHGLRFDALVQPRHLPALRRFAARYPDLPIVIDHAAKPPIGDGAWLRWADDLAALAQLPNVHCKLSGLVTEASPDATPAMLQPYARHVLDIFTPRRVMWGSDWPVLDLNSSYGAWMAATGVLLQHLSDSERAQVMGGTAQRFYGITTTAS